MIDNRMKTGRVPTTSMQHSFDYSLPLSFLDILTWISYSFSDLKRCGKKHNITQKHRMHACRNNRTLGEKKYFPYMRLHKFDEL